MQQHTTLYLKYRPQTFDELEGQQFIKQTLKNASLNNSLSHAYLFCGPRGTGKTSSARIVAKALCCTQKKEDGNPCGVCEICTEISLGTLTDVIEIDAASHRGIDDIRQMRERIRFAPNKAEKKVYIIDEVHMLTKDASNALLKTLEEPPSHVHFILATTEFQKLLPTVLSRCQVFHFLPFTDDELRLRLSSVLKSEEILYEEDALDPIIHAAHGGMRDALSVLEKVIFPGETMTTKRVREGLGMETSDVWSALYSALLQQQSETVYTICEGFWKEGKTAESLLKEFLLYLRTHLKQSVLEKKTSTHSLLHLVRSLEEGIHEMRKSLYPELTCERLLLEYIFPSFTSVPDVLPVPTLQTQSPSEPKIVEQTTPSITKRPIGTPANTVSVVEKQKEEIHEAIPHTSSRTEDAPLTMSGIRKDWEAFSQAIPGTIVRLTVKDQLRPIELKDDILTLSCTSDFHKAIINKKEHQLLIEQTFNTFFKTSLTLVFPGEGQPVVVKKSLPSATKQVSPTPEKTSTEPAQMDLDKIADFFGGSVTM